MRLGYLDSSGGISAATLLAALLSAGADESALRAAVGTLDVPTFELRIDQMDTGQVASMGVTVRTKERDVTRRLRDIRGIFASSGLGEFPRRIAGEVYRRLAHAEARIHGTTPESVSFHEVGRLESIVCVAGAATALEMLNIDRMLASPISTGRGTVSTSHGILPIPAPATAELLRGLPAVHGGTTGELTTPTGAALVATLATEFGAEPPMTAVEVGYGATTLIGGTTRLTRVLVGEVPSG